MRAPAHHHRYTFEDYLALEESSNVKHEYLDGEIYAMAGGTPEHAALSAAASHLLFAQLRGGRCRPLSSDARVRVLATGLTTYPDVTVVCGPWELDGEKKPSIVNPTLLVEVLSPTTEDFDRGEKFDHYRQIASLQQYVLVAQSERRVEVRTRGADGAWTVEAFGDGGVAAFDSVGARLEVRELYDAAAEPLA